MVERMQSLPPTLEGREAVLEDPRTCLYLRPLIISVMSIELTIHVKHMAGGKGCQALDG